MLDFNDLDDNRPIGKLVPDLFNRVHWGTWADFYAYGDAINQSSSNQSEDSNLSINQARAPWIDRLIDSRSGKLNLES